MTARYGSEIHQPGAYRGYEFFNGPFTHASVALLDRLEVSQMLGRGEHVDLESLNGNGAPTKYLKAALDWLYIHGFIDFVDERTDQRKIRPTEKGKNIFSHADLVRASVETYGRIKNAMKWDTGLANGREGELDEMTGGYWRKEPLSIAMVPVAAAYSGLASSKDGMSADKTIAGTILEKRIVSKKDLFPEGLAKPALNNRIGMVQVLLEAGVLEITMDKGRFTLTEKGRKLLELSGYAQLVVSYYDLLEKLYALHKGKEKYGLHGTVNRDAEINAHASNGILSVRVAPYLIDALGKEPLLAETLAGDSAFIDYGSGGADMLMQAAGKGPKNLRHFYGIDINPKTVDEAEKILESKGMAGQVSLVKGSITERQSLLEVAAMMKEAGLTKGVATINFILHDIGRQLSEDFLWNHARVFGSMPLMITETLRMPLDVCKANRNYQAPTFQFMHDASGQELYEEQDLRDLLEKSGYQIVTEKTHSSMPNADGSKKLPTIVTWLTRYAGG